MLRNGLTCFVSRLYDKLILHHYTTPVPLPFQSAWLLDIEAHQPRRTRPRFPGSCLHYISIMKLLANGLKFEFEKVARQPADTAQSREQFQHAGVGCYLRGRNQVKCANSDGSSDHKQPQPDTGGQRGEEQRALPASAQETDQGGQQVEQSRDNRCERGRKRAIK